MLDQLRREDFAELIGQTVEVRAGESSTRLEIAEALPLQSPSPRSTPPFRVTLRSRDDWRAPQGMFRIEHPRLGSLDLFAVPSGPDGIGYCYEITFN
jgi:hypothetical protein